MHDSMTKDASSNTILHIACQHFHGDTSLLEYILSTGKADPLCCNKHRKTPIMMLPDVKSRKKVQQLFSRFGRVKVSHPIESYVNLVFLGNPGVGKSSLVKVINDRSSLSSTLFGKFRNVSGVELCTAGIIPHILIDKDLGRIILHDLAGQAEYYTSHTAVLENLLQGSAAVFVLVVSLTDKSIQETFQFWLTVIENVSHNALQQCHLFVVASHADLVTNSSVVLNTLKAILTNRFPSSTYIIEHDEIINLDCRKIGGSQLNLLISSLSKACKSVSSNTKKDMSLYCHMLYDFFQRDEKVVYRLESLLTTANEQSDLLLPTNIDSLFDIVNTLSSTGLIVFLINKASPEKSWIVTDKSFLLGKLDGVLFAPTSFEQHEANIVSNSGVIKLSKLKSLFPNYDSDLLVQFLQYMKLCEVITEDFIKLLSKNKDVDSDQCIFVPALIKETQIPEIEEPFMFGWFLRCTNPHHFFLSRFLHLILLHLTYTYSISTHGANEFERDCKIWTTGIYWKDTKGVQTLVEVVDNNQSLLLLMRCQDGAAPINEMIKLIKSVIIEILTCKQQVLPKVDTCEFIIDNYQLQYP